jgi:hypothetical protein
MLFTARRSVYADKQRHPGVGDNTRGDKKSALPLNLRNPWHCSVLNTGED